MTHHRITWNYGGAHVQYHDAAKDAGEVIRRIMPDKAMRAVTEFTVTVVDSLPKTTRYAHPHPKDFPAAHVPAPAGKPKPKRESAFGDVPEGDMPFASGDMPS